MNGFAPALLIAHNLRLSKGVDHTLTSSSAVVSQGSVLGPILYVLYTALLADILRFHKMEFHFYAGDTHLYISFSTNKDVELTNSITKIEECLSVIDKSMSINPRGGGYFRNFWVGMCRWEPGTLTLYQS